MIRLIPTFRISQPTMIAMLVVKTITPKGRPYNYVLSRAVCTCYGRETEQLIKHHLFQHGLVCILSTSVSTVFVLNWHLRFRQFYP